MENVGLCLFMNEQDTSFKSNITIIGVDESHPAILEKKESKITKSSTKLKKNWCSATKYQSEPFLPVGYLLFKDK